MSGGFEEKLNAILGDKNAMGQIMALAQSLSQTEEPAEAAAPYVPTEAEEAPASSGMDLGALLGSVDPAMLQLGMRLVQEYNRGDDDATALLKALRPFVKPSRYARLDKAARAARLSRVVRVLLGTLKQSRGVDDV